MLSGLEGKVAVVTGGAGGIGSATARRLSAEGCRVVVMRATVSEPLGATGDEQADDPESVARWIAAFDAIPPLEMTVEEEELWRTAREDQKSREIAGFEQRARRIESQFP